MIALLSPFTVIMISFAWISLCWKSHISSVKIGKYFSKPQGVERKHNTYNFLHSNKSLLWGICMLNFSLSFRCLFFLFSVMIMSSCEQTHHCRFKNLFSHFIVKLIVYTKKVSQNWICLKQQQKSLCKLNTFPDVMLLTKDYSS